MKIEFKQRIQYTKYQLIILVDKNWLSFFIDFRKKIFFSSEIINILRSNKGNTKEKINCETRIYSLFS